MCTVKVLAGHTPCKCSRALPLPLAGGSWYLLACGSIAPIPASKFTWFLPVSLCVLLYLT